MGWGELEGSEAPEAGGTQRANVSHPLDRHAGGGGQRQALSERSGGGSGICAVTASENESPVRGQLVDARNSTHRQTIFLNEVNQQMPNSLSSLSQFSVEVCRNRTERLLYLNPTRVTARFKCEWSSLGNQGFQESSKQNQLKATESNPEINSGQEHRTTTWLPQITHKLQR